MLTLLDLLNDSACAGTSQHRSGLPVLAGCLTSVQTISLPLLGMRVWREGHCSTWCVLQRVLAQWQEHGLLEATTGPVAVRAAACLVTYSQDRAVSNIAVTDVVNK